MWGSAKCYGKKEEEENIDLEEDSPRRRFVEPKATGSPGYFPPESRCLTWRDISRFTTGISYSSRLRFPFPTVHILNLTIRIPPHKRCEEHCQYNPGGGVHSVVLFISTTLRAKGTLISEPRFSTPCEMRFSHAIKGNGPFRGFFLGNGHFPVSRGKNRMSQGVENRSSLISALLALREFAHRPSEGKSFVGVEWSRCSLQELPTWVRQHSVHTCIHGLEHYPPFPRNP